MTLQSLYPAFLVFHITGIILFIGTTVVDTLVVGQFWKQYERDPSQAKVVWQAVSKFQPFMGIGMVVILITAVGMMSVTHGVFGEQTWLRIKVSIVVLTILNGLLVRRRQGTKLSKLLQEVGTDISAGVQKVKRNLRAFHLVQLLFFFAILVLSVYKFN